MLKILYRGIQANLALNPAHLSGDVEADAENAYIKSMKGGRLVAQTSVGIELADGANDKPVGFLVNDAAGYFFENKPGIASGLAAVTLGNCVVITDQIDTDLTFEKGQAVYAGTGAKAGLVTNVAPFGGVKADLVVQDLTYVAKVVGLYGNNINITYVDPADINQALAILVAGNSIIVSLATDGAGTITSTAQEVNDAIVADADASALVDVSVTGTAGTVQTADPVANLTGGADGANPIGIADSAASSANPELTILVV